MPSPLPVFPSLAAEPLRLLAQQADLQYHAASARGIFNPPSATHMGFWSINPYIGCAFGCAYCYARDIHRYTLERAGPIGLTIANHLPLWLAFETRILVKEHAAAQVRDALRSSRAPKTGDSLVIGSATDPYQPAERRFRITESVLLALAEADIRGWAIVIITKSPLVTRDIPVLQRLARHNTVGVHISLITADRDLARRLEPRAPTPEARLRAIRRLAVSAIDVSVNCMPVLPGITDQPEMLRDLVARIAETGARSLGACALRLRSPSRRRYLPMIREHFPALAARYESTYRKSAYATDRYRAGLSQHMRVLAQQHGLVWREYRSLEPGYDVTGASEVLAHTTDHMNDTVHEGAAAAEQLTLAFTATRLCTQP